MSFGDAATYIGCNRSTVYALVARGALNSYTVAGRPALWKPEVLTVRDARAVMRGMGEQ